MKPETCGIVPVTAEQDAAVLTYSIHGCRINRPEYGPHTFFGAYEIQVFPHDGDNWKFACLADTHENAQEIAHGMMRGGRGNCRVIRTADRQECRI